MEPASEQQQQQGVPASVLAALASPLPADRHISGGKPPLSFGQRGWALQVCTLGQCRTSRWAFLDCPLLEALYSLACIPGLQFYMKGGQVWFGRLDRQRAAVAADLVRLWRLQKHIQGPPEVSWKHACVAFAWT